MKMRNKGKVHPFNSSSSSSSSYTPNNNDFPVLKLLPAAILTLLSLFSFEDREVLAYMITRSLKSTIPSFFPAEDKPKKSSKKQGFDGHGHNSPALFDCDCFHCYTSFWCKWDSSPNRELIHQAIEAFEEHLNNGEQFRKKSSGNGKNRRKEKMGRRKTEKLSSVVGGGVLEFPAAESGGNRENLVSVAPEIEVAPENINNVNQQSEGAEVGGVAEEDSAVEAPVVVVRCHKGLARKVLPDFMGIFSSRLWNLWSPKV